MHESTRRLQSVKRLRQRNIPLTNTTPKHERLEDAAGPEPLGTGEDHFVRLVGNVLNVMRRKS